jgi:signal transduction histidine kinase
MVRVALQATLESVTFEIEDHGPGIAPLDIAKIFDRFSRSGLKEGGALKGSGLGLSIVKSIAERHAVKYGLPASWGREVHFIWKYPSIKVKNKFDIALNKKSGIIFGCMISMACVPYSISAR